MLYRIEIKGMLNRIIVKIYFIEWRISIYGY